MRNPRVLERSAETAGTGRIAKRQSEKKIKLDLIHLCPCPTLPHVTKEVERRCDGHARPRQLGRNKPWQPLCRLLECPSDTQTPT